MVKVKLYLKERSFGQMGKNLTMDYEEYKYGWIGMKEVVFIDNGKTLVSSGFRKEKLYFWDLDKLKLKKIKKMGYHIQRMVYDDINDLNGHGTRCAGIICGGGNSINDHIGVTWNCKVIPIRVADVGFTKLDNKVIY